MEQKPNQKFYYGNITPSDFARDLISHFHRGNLSVQQIGSGPSITVQIATRNQRYSGGQTALSIRLQKLSDGVSVSVGKQAWLGVAASLGFTALAAMRNPLNLLTRIDDLAQDIESLQLTDEVWGVIEETARSHGVSHELSEKLKRLVCSYCDTANEVGSPNCIACGAPLGKDQPKTCKNCGFVIRQKVSYCPNCKMPL